MRLPSAVATPLALLSLALPMAARADGLALTYADFEQGVPHVDLPLCPEPLDGPARFCRLTVHADGLNVFVFSEEGDQPLIGFRSWPAELLVGLMD